MHKYKQKKNTKKRSKKQKRYSHKRHCARVSRSRKYYIGGLTKNDDKIEDLKNIIAKYIQTEETNVQNGSPETPKYKSMKENLDTYKSTIASKHVSALNDDDLAIIQKLVFKIIDDSYGMSIVTKGIAQFQKAINNVVLYFINDIELNDTTDFILKKRIINNTPYVDVIRKKDGHETTYDVNEMFALLKSEIKNNGCGPELKKTFLQKLTIGSKFGLEQAIPAPKQNQE